MKVRGPPSPVAGLGGEQIEGRRAVRELLVAGRRRARDVWLSETLDRSPVIDEICDVAGKTGVPIRRVPRSRLAAEAQSVAPQGVLAHAPPLEPVELELLCRRGPPDAPKPFLVALDGIKDPQNLGALLRSAEVAGATGVVLPRHGAVRITPTVAKVAAGAIEYLPIALVGGLAAAMVTLRDQGVWTVGLEPGAREPLFGFSLASEPVAVVLGAEGTGLSRLVSQRCDVRVGIPLAGALGSLNVAAAGTLALFEVARQRLA
jgi:23S rRNA (guanosine2251-2'-O)-methyltransferase